MVSSTKFTTKSELALFKALQNYGKLSSQLLAKKTKLLRSTIQYAYDRLKERDFFETKAIPKLERFPELPIALISFDNLHPIRLRKLQKIYLKKEEIRVFIINSEQIFIIIMHSSKDRLHELIYEITEKAQAKPTFGYLGRDLNSNRPVVIFFPDGKERDGEEDDRD